MRRHVVANPEAWLGNSHGNGECAVLVEMAAPHLGLTKHWKPGPFVMDVMDDLRPGTIVATFNARGEYANATDGSSHAAIFMAPATDGFHVIDQWHGHACSRRVIHKNHHPPCNDALAFRVVLTEEGSDDGV